MGIITNKNFFLTIALLLTLCVSANAESALRIVCEGPDEGAKIYINGKFKGECPSDLFLPAGKVKLRAVMNVDKEYERVFEKEFTLFDDSAKKVEVFLSSPQLTADAVRERRLAQERQDRATFNETLAKARKGDINAMNTVSSYYYQGLGVEKSAEKASFWDKKAFEATEIEKAKSTLASAEAGDIESMETISEFYRIGKGIKKDSNKAKMWHDRAVQAKNEADKKVAMATLKSANAGDIEAMKKIAAFYQSGTGVEQSDSKSQQWYKKADIAEDEEIEAEEKAAIEAQLKHHSFFKNTESMVEPNKGRPSTWPFVTTSLPSFILSDITESPSVTTKRQEIKNKLAARSSVWNNPDSMIAKAYKKEEMETNLQEEALLRLK